MKSAKFAAALAMTLLGGIATALAAPAITTGNANVRQGASATAPVLTSLPAGATLDANCYDQGWCQVNGTGNFNGVSGWISASLVAFTDGSAMPQPPRPGPQPGPGPQPQPPRPGGNNSGPGFSFDFNFGTPPQTRPQPSRQSGACFFTERNFRGSSFCVERGQEYTRMPRGWNDVIRSVQVFGRAQVDLCSDNGFYGNCVTVRSDQSRLPSGIDRRVSSIDVY
ncbi:SH3 domain-containing protein [Devosia sp. FJ2-5-3]|jgi:hypothetical protein|uniref:SH3 domain-containing protein n=1 Tax=Devosia sp. FJ2-5-3 TaxID=2976680 RepID=UPI0023D80CCA|nr:SH3 domain-containing protein [Devosia sp. FJ2-5-3]WEJ59618.1 SH3 domain-containing protein [Devosia sp. FJ2-5-3]